MNIFLIVLGHLFTFVAAIAGLLLGLSFTDVQLEQYPFLHWLDGQQIPLAVTAVVSFVIVMVTNLFKDVKKEFETVQGPKGEVFQKATESGFEKELKDAADELKAKAKHYFEAAEEDFKPGSYEDAARNYQKSIDLLPTMSAFLNAGLAWFYVSSYTEAEQVFLAGLQLAREKEAEKFKGVFLGNIGIVYQLQGKLKEGLEAHQEALEIDKKIGDPLDQANQLGNIGIVFHLEGKLEEALETYQQALKIHKKIGNLLGQANNLCNIGNIYYQQGILEKALETYQQTLEIHKKVGNPLGQATILGNIGNVYSDQGMPEEGVNVYQQALEIYERIGNSLGQANQLNNIGVFYEEQNKLDEALRYYQQARGIFERIETPLGLNIAEDNIKRVTKKL